MENELVSIDYYTRESVKCLDHLVSVTERWQESTLQKIVRDIEEMGVGGDTSEQEACIFKIDRGIL